METLGAASEVQAVNELIATIGEDPVEDIENLPPSGNTALSILRGVARDFQEEGHWFNQETDYELKPNKDNIILIPPEVLRIDSVEGDCIQRGDKLYNVESKTLKFEDSILCDVVVQLPWNELPSVARRYITAVAIEKFVDGFPAAQATTEARLRNLLRAKVAFDRASIKNGDYNLLKNTAIAQKIRRK